jgi:soluble lytic murein transglycosylase-like protein
MRGIPTPSTDCSSADPSPIFPYRPRPKTTKRSPSLQRKSHISDLAISIARPGSLRPIARIIVAVAQSMCLVAAPMLFELGVCAQTASHTPTIDRFAKFIAEASVRFAVPAFWIRAVIQIESAGDAHSISPRGAMSLMQLMPGTWVELSVLYSLGLDPFDARDNILAGTAYLKRCTTVSARQAFLRPTMQVRGDMNSTS